jgi:hypothetical protein
MQLCHMDIGKEELYLIFHPSAHARSEYASASLNQHPLPHIWIIFRGIDTWDTLARCSCSLRDLSHLARPANPSLQLHW